MAAAGVLIIGAVNVAVSFILALHVALEANARDSRSTDSRLIVRAALRRWARGKSTDTLRPVQKELPPAHLDSGAARPM
jgi:site-specific recombinase